MRFRSVILERFWFLKYKTINPEHCIHLDDVTMEEFQLFHSIIAPHAIEFVIPKGKKYNFQDHYLKLEYPNLRELNCQSNYFDNDELMNLLGKFPQLEVLHLKDLCPTNQHLAKIPHLRELVLTISNSKPVLLEQLLNERKEKRNISRMYLEDRSKFILSDVAKYFTNSTEITYYLKREELVVMNYDGPMPKLFDFLYSLRTLNELYFYADIKITGLFRLIDNNSQLEHIYLGRGLDVPKGSGKWLCRLSDYLHDGRQHKQIITIHLDWPAMCIQKSQKILEAYDVRRGHQAPAIGLKKLFDLTISHSEDTDSFRFTVKQVNIMLQKMYEYKPGEVDWLNMKLEILAQKLWLVGV